MVARLEGGRDRAVLGCGLGGGGGARLGTMALGECARRCWMSAWVRSRGSARSDGCGALRAAVTDARSETYLRLTARTRLSRSDGVRECQHR